MKTSSLRYLLAATGFTAALSPSVASAADWTGAANASWATNANWSNNAPPGQGITFGTGTVARPIQTLDGSYTVYSVVNGSNTAITLNGGTGSNTLTLTRQAPLLHAKNANLTIAQSILIGFNGGAPVGIEADLGRTLEVASNIFTNSTTGGGAILLAVRGAGTVTLTGVISGTGSVSKNGDGVFNISGANSYSGGTAVGAGTLVAAGVASLGSGAVTVGGGTLSVGAAGVAGIASLTVNTGGLDTTAGAITTTGSFLLAGGTWSVGNTANGVVAGSFDLTGGNIDLAGYANKSTAGVFSLIDGTGTSALTNGDFINGDEDFTYGINTNGDLVVTAVPEPSTYGLLGAGALAGAAVLRRRRCRGKVA